MKTKLTVAALVVVTLAVSTASCLAQGANKPNATDRDDPTAVTNTSHK